ncbi:MAG: potassium transporter TrkA [Chloroflexi bacterium]|nr:potassium transporter TrkA [Chloroflexota bacterium]
MIKRLRYSFDNLFSMGPGGLIAWLGLLSLLMAGIMTALLTLTGMSPGGEEHYGVIEAAWLSLVSVIGEGSVAGREAAWGYRLLTLGITFGSIFVTSMLIGILTSGIQARFEDLRKGRSEVAEQGHTVILGWSEQIFTIIPELVQANASQPSACIVVLGEEDKVAMEDQLRQKIGSTGRTRIVCRTGSPMEMNDLSIVNLNQARAILVLSPKSENSDAGVLKTILAITNHPQRRPAPYHIVASLRSPKNYEVARIAGRGEVEWVLAAEIISRIIAQTCRQSGLSVVYTELLDFGHNEIYFCPAGAFTGRTFGEALLASGQDAVVGIFTGARAWLNPPMDTRLQDGDQLILIAADNTQVVFDQQGAGLVQPAAISLGEFPPPHPERTLLLGWNWRGRRILHELDHYVAPGSEVMVAADHEHIRAAEQSGCQDLSHQGVCYAVADITDRQALESLEPGRYDHIVLLCYSDTLSVQQADAQTMITLLHLRDIAEQNGYSYSIVSEMLDVRNRRLAAVTRADDFIVSERIISLMMAQVVENKALNAIFAELFDPQGAEIYLKPAAAYVCPGEAVHFATLVAAASRRGEVAIGYRLASQALNPEAAYGVVLNPPKAQAVTLGPQDRVIVLANN